MKKLLLFSIITVQLFSCTKQLDQVPLSVASVDGFYGNTKDFQKAINGIYSTLRFYPNAQLRLSEVRSDNIYVQAATDQMNANISRFQLSLAINTYVEEAWNVDFRGIMKANTLLDKLNEKVVPEEADRNRIEGQAKFLRAFYYFDALRWFGPLPLNKAPLTPTEVLANGRSSVEDIYDFIIADLEDAIRLLPDSYPPAETGYATSYAARGILARVYLTRSGPKIHPDGPCLGTNEYQKALDLLNEIIAGPYEMLTNYPSIFSFFNENNKEIIFAIQFKSGAGVGASYPTVLTGTTWWNSVNLPFQGAGDRNSVAVELINSYGEDDIRLDNNVVLEYTSQGVFIQDNPTCVKFASADKATWGVFRDDFGTDFPVLRFTDVLLMKAECILQGAAGTQTEVDDIVNAVRARAQVDPVSDVTLDFLLEERRKEFLGEGLRWHDIVRTGKVLDIMNAWIPTVDLGDQMTYPINSDHIIYPIPQSEIEIKKGLYYQNKGYY